MRSNARASSRTLVVHVADARSVRPDDPAVTRAGFVVGRSVGGAVVRNRVTRRLRHIVADRLPSLPPGLAIVVRATPAAAQAPSQQLGHDFDVAMKACLGRLGQGARTGRRMSP